MSGFAAHREGVKARARARAARVTAQLGGSIAQDARLAGAGDVAATPAPAEAAPAPAPAPAPVGKPAAFGHSLAARQRGRMGARQGDDLAVNPFVRGTVSHTAWIAGWYDQMEAHDDSERRR